MKLLKVALGVFRGHKQLSTNGTTRSPRERVTKVAEVAVLVVVGVADVVVLAVATALPLLAAALLVVASEAKVERDQARKGSTILLRPTGTILLRTWSWRNMVESWGQLRLPLRLTGLHGLLTRELVALRMLWIP